MTEAGYYEGDSKMEVPLDDSPGPIRNLLSALDKELDVLQKELSRLQAKLQPVLRETDGNVKSIPRQPREEMGVSPVARLLQESVERVENDAERIRELSGGLTI